MKAIKSVLCVSALVTTLSVPADVVIPHNNYLVYADVIESNVGSSNRVDFFRRMLTYVDKNSQSVDSFMDGFTFMQSTNYFQNGGKFGACTSSADCSTNIHVDNYFSTHFDSGGYLDSLRGAEVLALNEMGEDFTRKIPEISVYFSIPYPQKEAVLETGQANPYYMDVLSGYLNSIVSGFQSWKAQNSSSKIVLRGFYLGRENLETYGGGKSLLPADGQNQAGSFLVELQDIVNSIDTNLALTASPYQNYYSSGGQLKMYTSYQGREESIFNGQSAGPLFDKAYIQPNAFVPSGKFLDMGDKELIRWTYNFYQQYSKSAFNMETNTMARFLSTGQSKEFFPEAVSYADYAKYLGLNNFNLMYYDAGYAYYDFSVNSDSHWIYQEAYKMAKGARDGAITNGSFEHFELVGPTSFTVGSTSNALSNYNESSLLGWTGNYSIGQNSGTGVAEYSWTTSGSSRPILGNFYLEPSKWYRLRFNVKENVNDGQTWSGIVGWRFFDSSGNQITTGSVGAGINYSTSLNAWYMYVNSTTTAQNLSASFQVPANAVKTELLAGKWSGTATLTWTNVNIQEPVSGLPGYIVGKNSGGQFVIRDLTSFGQAASLGKNEFVESSDTFNITGGLNYTLSHESRIQPGQNCTSYNGLIGVKFYDHNGAQYTGSVSGLTWSGFLGLHYRYFIASENVKNHTNTFTAPLSSSSAKIQLKNWYCDSEIFVDNVTLNDTAHPLGTVSFPGEAKGMDQDNLVRLTTENGQARFQFDLDVGSFSTLNFLSRANCSQFGTSSCQASLDLELLYLDSNGYILNIEKVNSSIAGQGEYYIQPGNDRYTYTHWDKNQHSLSFPQASSLIVVVRRGSGTNIEELLLSRLHLQ